MTVDTAISVVPVLDAELEAYPPVREEVIEGELDMRAAFLWVSDDRTSATGIWHCPPVKLSLVHPFNETFVVLSGRLTVTPEDGEARELGPGDAIVLPYESVNVWDIHETVTKVFAVHHTPALPI